VRELANPWFAWNGDHRPLTADRDIEPSLQLAKLRFATDEGRSIQRGSVQAG
jgi:hypothetical protein